jgi:hypothetical protein
MNQRPNQGTNPTTSNATSPAPAPQPITSVADAEKLVRHLLAAMDALVATVEQETALVRAGNVKQAAGLEAIKAELARAYVAHTAQVKANLPALKTHIPDLLAKLQQQHDSFRALLQINLTVLATSHAVSESLIRGAHAELARKSAPQTYGNSGRTNAPSKGTAVPVSVSRTL